MNSLEAGNELKYLKKRTHFSLVIYRNTKSAFLFIAYSFLIMKLSIKKQKCGKQTINTHCS